MEFTKVKIGSVAKFSQGIQVPIGKQYLTDTPERIKFIRITDITSNGNEPPRYILDPGKKYCVTASDLFMVRYGSPQIVKGWSGALANNFFKLEVTNADIDKEWLFYYLSQEWVKRYCLNISVSATMPAISFKTFRNLEIHYPSCVVQNKIVQVLSTYDSLIKNNVKRIKLLEEKAKLTYEEWFVRMRFPGHETTPINNETGLPEGWEKVKLNEILKFNQGVQVPIDKQLKEKNPERVRFIRIVDVTQGGQEERFIETPRKNQMVAEKDLFMVRYGAPQVVTNFKGAIANNFFKINIIDSSKVFPKYVYCFLDRKEIREYLMGVSVSATMPAISFKSFGQIKMVLPEISLQKKFHDYVDSIFELILSLETQNQRLKEALDILLPRLMKGMIDVEQMNLETLKQTTA